METAVLEKVIEEYKNKKAALAHRIVICAVQAVLPMALWKFMRH